jgi:hypothetical protein
MRLGFGNGDAIPKSGFVDRGAFRHGLSAAGK